MAWLPYMIPVLALLIPIVAILTVHQQKMAQILHRSGTDVSEISNLRKELADLKALVHQQTITLDSIATNARQLPPRPPQPETSAAPDA